MWCGFVGVNVWVTVMRGDGWLFLSLLMLVLMMMTFIQLVDGWVDSSVDNGYGNGDDDDVGVSVMVVLTVIMDGLIIVVGEGYSGKNDGDNSEGSCSKLSVPFYVRAHRVVVFALPACSQSALTWPAELAAVRFFVHSRKDPSIPLNFAVFLYNSGDATTAQRQLSLYDQGVKTARSGQTTVDRDVSTAVCVSAGWWWR